MTELDDAWNLTEAEAERLLGALRAINNLTMCAAHPSLELEKIGEISRDVVASLEHVKLVRSDGSCWRCGKMS